MKTNTVYHIYNQCNGSEKLFREDENYRYFLKKMKRYLLPVCDIYAYCLMPCHFHFLIKTKTNIELQRTIDIGDTTKVSSSFLQKKISKAFANLFSSYALAYNKAYYRSGSLFRPNMKQEMIISSFKFKSVVHFIHSNPVIHHECSSIEDWKFSSFRLYHHSGVSWVKKDEVINKFKGMKELRRIHSTSLPYRLKIY